MRNTKNSLDGIMRFEDRRLCSIIRKQVHCYESEYISLTNDSLRIPLTGKGKYIRINDECLSSFSKEPTKSFRRTNFQEKFEAV